MPSCAATFDADGNEKTKIHVFYNQQNKNLGLLFRNEQSNSQAQFNNFASGGDAVPGSIINPSYLAVTKFNNQDFVFGVTDKKSASINQSSNAVDPNGCKCPPDAKEVDLSLISPVYMVVSPYVYSDNYRIAACCSDADNWIYYLKKKGSDLNLYETMIGDGNDNEYTELTKVAPNSALAAWYGPVDNKRHIIYQSTAGPDNLYEFTADSHRQIDQAAGVRNNTSVAVAVTKNGVYLYYINTNRRISRVSKNLEESAQFANYTVVKSCTNDAAVDAQLTVTIAGDNVHIFYTAENQNKQNVVSHFVDKSLPTPPQ
ncbi:hypothetical protein FCOIX_13390 [Fusarium coicis]|nr:hypothetical protein FCOIX_13390 [Fusarium coicis]